MYNVLVAFLALGFVLILFSYLPSSGEVPYICVSTYWTNLVSFEEFKLAYLT